MTTHKDTPQILQSCPPSNEYGQRIKITEIQNYVLPESSSGWSQTFRQKLEADHRQLQASRGCKVRLQTSLLEKTQTSHPRRSMFPSEREKAGSRQPSCPQFLKKRGINVLEELDIPLG